MNHQELIRLLTPLYGCGEARAVVRLVMEERFGLTQTDLLLGKDTTLSADERKEFEKIAQRLVKGEPVQYVLGYTLFCGHRFRVTPDVLIPRPETEELVHVSLESLTMDIAREKAHPLSPKILDLCTGSGCIAIAVALALPEAEVIGIDISEAALDVARLNASTLGAANVRFFRADVLADCFDAGSPADLIISNPPYVRQSEATSMGAHVVNHEPHVALFVPDDDALRFYRAIAAVGRRILRHGRQIAVEINSALSAETSSLFEASGFQNVKVREDQFGRPRILQCTAT